MIAPRAATGDDAFDARVADKVAELNHEIAVARLELVEKIAGSLQNVMVALSPQYGIEPEGGEWDTLTPDAKALMWATVEAVIIPVLDAGTRAHDESFRAAHAEALQAAQIQLRDMATIDELEARHADDVGTIRGLESKLSMVEHHRDVAVNAGQHLERKLAEAQKVPMPVSQAEATIERIRAYVLTVHHDEQATPREIRQAADVAAIIVDGTPPTPPTRAEAMHEAIGRYRDAVAMTPDAEDLSVGTRVFTKEQDWTSERWTRGRPGTIVRIYMPERRANVLIDLTGEVVTMSVDRLLNAGEGGTDAWAWRHQDGLRCVHCEVGPPDGDLHCRHGQTVWWRT